MRKGQAFIPSLYPEMTIARINLTNYTSSGQPEPPSSQFCFGTTVVRVKSELIVRTKRGFPFLLYNCARSTTGFRTCFPCPDLRSLPRSIRKSLGSVDFTSEMIDPFYVAGLISLAQKQLKFSNYLDKPPPDIFKVRLVSIRSMGMSLQLCHRYIL